MRASLLKRYQALVKDHVGVTFNVSPFWTLRAAAKLLSENSVPVVPPMVLLSQIPAPFTVMEAVMLNAMAALGVALKVGDVPLEA